MGPLPSPPSLRSSYGALAGDDEWGRHLVTLAGDDELLVEIGLAGG
jgi:hypothetical protein